MFQIQRSALPESTAALVTFSELVTRFSLSFPCDNNEYNKGFLPYRERLSHG